MEPWEHVSLGPKVVLSPRTRDLGGDLSRENSFDGHGTSRPESIALGMSDGVDIPCLESSDAATGWESRQGLRQHVKAWAPEGAWCFLSIAILIALVVLLSQYDEKPLPQWSLGLTLNTLTAVLTTLCRSCTVIPIAEGLSQLKWNWFATSERPIRDLYAFDQASRGPWGSLRLIAKMRGRLLSLSTIAALVLVSGVATSFITQSAISYAVRIVEKESDDAVTWKSTFFGSEKNENTLNLAMKQVAFQAIFSPPDQDIPPLEAKCPSANCQWPTFSSLGVCTSMANLTDQLHVTSSDADVGQDIEVRLSDNDDFWLRETTYGTHDYETLLNMTTGRHSQMDDLPYPWERKTYFDWKNPDIEPLTFLQVFFLYHNPASDPDDLEHKYRAVEVLWHFCVRTYNVTVQDGITKTQTLSTTVKVHDSQAQPPKANLTDASGSEIFQLSFTQRVNQLDNDLQDVFRGHSTTDPYGSEHSTEFTAQCGRSLFSGLDVESTAAEVDDGTWDNLERLSGNIAQSMTSKLRTAYPEGEMRGVIQNSETIVVIRWEWLSLVATQIVLTMAFLLAVIWHTARLNVSIVKTSNMAELLAISKDKNYDNNKNNYGVQVSAPAGDGHTIVGGIRAHADGGLVGKLARGANGWALHVRQKAQQQQPGTI